MPYAHELAPGVDIDIDYVATRCGVVDAHLRSVQVLMEKEMDKFPEKAREIALALRTVERLREDISALLS